MNSDYLIVIFLHPDLIEWNVSKSTLDRVWSVSFPDVKIPATNRFSKCEICERLKKMLHTRNIEDDHNLSQQELNKLELDKVIKLKF